MRVSGRHSDAVGVPAPDSPLDVPRCLSLATNLCHRRHPLPLVLASWARLVRTASAPEIRRAMVRVIGRHSAVELLAPDFRLKDPRLPPPSNPANPRRCRQPPPLDLASWARLRAASAPEQWRTSVRVRLCGHRSRMSTPPSLLSPLRLRPSTLLPAPIVSVPSTLLSLRRCQLLWLSSLRSTSST